MKKLLPFGLVIAGGVLLTNVFAQNSIKPDIKTALNAVSFQTLSVDSFETKINSLAGAQIVDTRLPEEYAINHLINAININAQQKDYAQQLDKLDKTKPVFAYAIGNGRSTQLANELIAKGYTQVYVLNGGIGGWIGNGKPIYSSSKDNFTINDLNTITANNRFVLLDLHTRYCPACRKLQPSVDSLATEYGAKLKIIRIDVYDNPTVAGTFKVNAIPTLVIYDKGKIIWQKTGGDIQKADVEAIINNLN